jgi:hypothetical protein
MRPAEYVEKIVADSFRREGDQEENVARTLPFFATALGVIATALIFIRPALCAPNLQPLTVAIYFALLATVVMVFIVLGLLSVAVWPRRFQVPMTEDALLGYAEQLMDYYTAPGPPTAIAASTIEEAIVDDLREAMTRQMATAATRSHSINSSRLKARSRALTALVFAISLAFVLVTLIFVRDTLFPGECNAGPQSGSSSPSGTEHSSRPNGATSSEAKAAGNAPNNQGGMDLQGGPAQNASTGGASVTNAPTTTASPQAPAPAPTTAPKPAPPPMQTITKGTEPGTLKK